jgi:hypothetical protein
MASINRLKKFLDAAHCSDTGEKMVSIEEAVLFLVKHGRSQNMNDEQLSDFLAMAFTEFLSKEARDGQ